MVQDNTYVTVIIQTFAAGFIANIGCYKIGMQLPSLFENTKHELVCLSVLRNMSKILIRHMCLYDYFNFVIQLWCMYCRPSLGDRVK